MLIPVVVAPVVMLSSGMSLFLFKQALITLKKSQNVYLVRLNAVCEEFIFGPADEIKFDMQIVCLVSILIVLINIRMDASNMVVRYDTEAIMHKKSK